MKTLAFLLCSAVAAAVSYADTARIELTCDLDITTESRPGESKPSHETVVVEMLLDPVTRFKAIVIHSVAIPVAVANKAGGAVTAFVDNSDENHWDISNRRDRSKVATDQAAAIDRISGRITAHSVTTVGEASQRVEARGTCAKIGASEPTK